jgi:hypothetical protein
MVKMDYKEKMKKVSEIVNKHIGAFTNNKTNEFDFSNGKRLFSPYGDKVINIFFSIFNEKAPTQKSISPTLFHYKRFDKACEFIEGNYIELSALSNFQNINYGDDIKEYEHFFEVAKIGTDRTFINSQKNDLFIFCMTSDNDNCTERFWKEYADGGKGLCLKLEISCTQSNILYDLNEICYDDGNKFQFFADMQNDIYSAFDKYLLIPGLAKFGALYKRNEYSWEKETRLLINWNLYKKNLEKYFTIEYNKEKKFLKIPFANELFTIKIKSIKIGKNLNDFQKEKIRKLAVQKEINID